MVNERIAFTHFTSGAIAAAVRWKERNTEVLASLPQPAQIPKHASLRESHSPAAPFFHPQPLPAVRRLTRKLPGVPEPLTVWRLVSGNHRELGRGAGTFDTQVLAAAHAQSLLDAAQHLRVSFVRHSGTGKFAWYAGLGYGPMLLAPAWFGTTRDCERSAAAALAAMHGAIISTSVVKYGPRYDVDDVPAVAPELQLR